MKVELWEEREFRQQWQNFWGSKTHWVVNSKTVHLKIHQLWLSVLVPSTWKCWDLQGFQEQWVLTELEETSAPANNRKGFWEEKAQELLHCRDCCRKVWNICLGAIVHMSWWVREVQLAMGCVLHLQTWWVFPRVCEDLKIHLQQTVCLNYNSNHLQGPCQRQNKTAFYCYYYFKCRNMV